MEIFSLYSRAPLHRENIVREMSPCFSRVTLLLAVDSLWTFAVISSQFAEMLYQTPRDHSPQQSRDRPSQKQTSGYKKRRSRKPRRRGAVTVNTLQSGTNESEILMKSVQSSYVIAQASHPPHRIVHNTGMAVFRTGDVRIVKHRLNNLIRAAAITTSFATAAQSCLHSPLPRSRVFTRHCRAVVSSLATATQSCLHSPLPRSRVFTCHCHAVVSSLATVNDPLRHSSVCVTV